MSLVSSFGLPPIATEITIDYSGIGPAMSRAGIAVDKGAKQITTKFDNIARQGAKLSKLGTDLTKYVSIPTAALGVVATKAAIEYESAFAGVRKTVDATEEEYKTLSDGIRQMTKEIPASAKSIAGVAEAAGQLGIQKEHLLSFARVMIDLGEATNLTADEGATQLARFANITRMSQKDFDKLGSTIVALGNNFATTEAEIVAMGMRLAGAGAQIGLTEAEIMGFATALSSVGIEAKAGGSAFSKLMINMGVASEVGSNANKVIKESGHSLRDLQMMASHDSKGFGELAQSLSLTKEELKKMVTASATLEGFSKVTGMTGEQFKKAFAEDAPGAIQKFIEGLKNADKNGQSAIAILDEMGIKEVRLRDTILRATGATELFNNAIELGNKSWEENNALNKEAEQRYATTESQLNIFKNKVIDLGISFGEKLLPHLIKLVDKASELVEWFGNLDDSTQQTILKMGGLAIALGPVTSLFGGVLTTVSKIPSVLGLLSKGLGLLSAGSQIAAPAISGVAQATSAVGTAAVTAGGSAGVGALTTGLGGAIAAAAPFVAGAAAVAGGAYLIYDSVTQKATPAVDKLADGFVVTGEIVTEVAGDMVKVQEKTAVKISEETKKQMQSYYDLSDGAQKATMEMYAGIIPTTETNVNKIKNDVEGMASKTKSAIESQKNTTIDAFQEMFTKSTNLTEEEKTRVLVSVEEMSTERKDKVEKMKDRVIELYEEIKNKGVENASSEKAELDKLYQDMAAEQIRAVTQSKNEQEVLLKNLKDNSSQITSKMVEEAIIKINERKDAGIAAAEEEYDKSIKVATQWKTDLELTYGQLTENQKKTYETMISDAENLKNKTVAEYDDLRYSGIKSLIESHGDLTRNIDFETGKQLSGWDKFKRGVGEVINGVESDINRLNKTRINDKSAKFTIKTFNETINTTVNRLKSRRAEALLREAKHVRYGLYSSGLDFVPYDGYKAHLHRGERVLTAEENKKYSKGSSGGVSINIEKIENNTKEDVRKLVRRIGEEVKRQKLGKGGI